MSSWYYADGSRQRRGPVDVEALRGLYRDGLIALDSLVWREGMPHWAPLAACAAEFGPPIATDVASSPLPPPLPPTAVGTTPPRPALSSSPRSTPVATARNGAGWAIGIAVGSVIGVVGLAFVLGIVAAIALPAYQDYTARAKVSQAIGALAPLKPQIAEFLEREGRCPTNDDAGFHPPEHYATGTLGIVRIGHFDTAQCGVEALLHTPDNAKLDGKPLWLDLDQDAGSWDCSSEIDDKFLPQDCRG
ncbi:pilin [Xanthomonas campestris]|uniref:pilin n=1 Tax=Xanthomonas campestris TaxID=339 RepID=UPI0023652DE4|nr:pilin [Xanthomonas campestris]WDJ05763.1 pilin [Xanthomonas campestris pv. incanae]